MQGRRRDELLASWEAEGAGVEAVVDALDMAMAVAVAKAGVDALVMAMAAAAGTGTTSASQGAVTFGDDCVVRELLDANDARMARDDDAVAGVDTLAMAIAAAGAEAGVNTLAMAIAAAGGTGMTLALLALVAFRDDCVVGEILDTDDRTCAHNNQTDHAEVGGSRRRRRRQRR